MSVYINASSELPTHLPELSSSLRAQILAFHTSLPDYIRTPLTPLPRLAQKLGLNALYIKDESSRLGLPSFKILGASWAVYRAVAEAIGMDFQRGSLEDIGKVAKQKGVQIVTCTEGNWGRAVARMAGYLCKLPVTVHVPAYMDERTREKIRSEGEHVQLVQVGGRGEYDDAVQLCMDEVQRVEREGDVRTLVILDTSFPGYEKIPLWVTQGYETMLAEVDSQLIEAGKDGPDLAVASVGVGSWAHAVVMHYKSGNRTKVVTVEPETAASLLTSLRNGQITPIETPYPTIMAGMNCGTTSLIAWPYLKTGVDVAASVSDMESHCAVKALKEEGVLAGPCGAAGLAALVRLKEENVQKLGIRHHSTVVLFSTEGHRDYSLPETI